MRRAGESVKSRYAAPLKERVVVGGGHSGAWLGDVRGRCPSRPSRVTQAKFNRIQVGMTRPEVEKVLGVVIPKGECDYWWYVEDGTSFIGVRFDLKDNVCAKSLRRRSI